MDQWPPADRDQFIQDNIPYIIKTASEVSGRYINTQHDEIYSVALFAFNEAIDRFDASRGTFYSIAKQVIRSRIIDYQRKNKHSQQESSLDKMVEEGYVVVDESHRDEDLQADIQQWIHVLDRFSITLEQLVEERPVHENTRYNAIEISRVGSTDQGIVSFLYEKLRLPIKRLSLKTQASEKVIRRSKTFITSVMVIFEEEFYSILRWIER